MKKLYMLIAAMLVFSVSFAQISPKQGYQMDSKTPIMPKVMKGANQQRGEAASQWFYYPDVVGSYWGFECDLTSYILTPDSNGLMFPTSSDPWHPNVHGWGQTYDFEHDVFTQLPEGSIVLGASDNVRIDSISVYGGYFRGSSYPADVVDTLIVGIFTDIENTLTNQTYSFSFYAIPYDPNTLVQEGAHIYKLPMTADMVSVEEGTQYYTAILDLPINLTLDTKLINIAYAFKRGMDIPVNDTLVNYSYFSAWLRTDPREGYTISSASAQFPFEDHMTNLNNGISCDHDLLYNYNPNGDWYYHYYTPNYFWQEFHYPMIFFKASCDNCEMVNVPELEKNNPTIYPNPATNNFTVDLGNDEKADIQLFNIVGQMVYSETITGTAQVNVANLHSGVYMLKVNQNGKTFTTKVVVK